MPLVLPPVGMRGRPLGSLNVDLRLGMSQFCCAAELVKVREACSFVYLDCGRNVEEGANFLAVDRYGKGVVTWRKCESSDNRGDDIALLVTGLLER